MAFTIPVDGTGNLAVLIHQAIWGFAAESEAELLQEISQIRNKKGVLDTKKLIQAELLDFYGVKHNKINEITLINDLAANLGITITAAEAQNLSAQLNQIGIVQALTSRAEVQAKFAPSVQQYLQKAAAGTAVYGPDSDLTTGGGAGQQLTLTPEEDNAIGGAGDDTIGGLVGDVTFFDDYDGGDGVDTLLIGDDKVNTSANFLVVNSIKNIEKLVYKDAENTDETINAQNMIGLDSVEYTSLTGTSNVVINTKSNATHVSVTGQVGNQNAVITDQGAAGTDKLSTVSLDGDANLTVNSDVLSKLSLANLAGDNNDVNVNAAAGTRMLDVTLNNVFMNNLNDNEATSVNLDVASKSEIDDLNIGKATTLTVKGNGALEIDGATFTKLTSIDASAHAGGLDIDAFTLGANVSFTGGSGTDSIKVGATTKAVTTGGGDDSVEVTAVFGAGGSVDAGDGTDTLTATTTVAAALSATDAFAKSVTGFERARFIDNNAAVAINMANLGNISHVTEEGFLSFGDVLTLNNFANAGTFVYSDANAFNSDVVVNLFDPGSILNVLNVELASAGGGFEAGRLNAVATETINIATTGTSQFDLDLIADNNHKTIKVSGNAGVDLNDIASGTGVTLFDASGVTGTGAAGSVTFTTGALTNSATIKGGAGDDFLNASAAGAKVTMEGGAGNDTLVGSAFNDTINAGDGNNFVTGGGGADTLTGGSGIDTYLYSLANSLESSGVTSDTITNFKAGVGGDVLAIDVTTPADFKLTEVANSLFINSALAATAGKQEAVFDKSTSTLIVDTNANDVFDAGDLSIVLTGVSGGLVFNGSATDNFSIT